MISSTIEGMGPSRQAASKIGSSTKFRRWLSCGAAAVAEADRLAGKRGSPNGLAEVVSCWKVRDEGVGAMITPSGFLVSVGGQRGLNADKVDPSKTSWRKVGGGRIGPVGRSGSLSMRGSVSATTEAKGESVG
jgi:hypothetical protein